jgi:SAM-dependent methyltransferase
VYEFLKRLLPRGLLIRFEWPLRGLLFLVYRGTAFECNVCRRQLSRFIRTNTDLMCPRCGSIRRNRRLFAVLESDHLKPGSRILDFSPSRALYRRLKAVPGIDYTSSDFANEFIADHHFDLTKLDLPDDSMDLVICYHVLEHIPDDVAAIREMHRILRPGGTSLIQTPFKEGSIDEDPTITSPDERRARFGQEDHVRTYSVEGLAERLRDSGFDAVVRTFSEEPSNYHGFSSSEMVLVARKHAA